MIDGTDRLSMLGRNAMTRASFPYRQKITNTNPRKDDYLRTFKLRVANATVTESELSAWEQAGLSSACFWFSSNSSSHLASHKIWFLL